MVFPEYSSYFVDPFDDIARRARRSTSTARSSRRSLGSRRRTASHIVAGLVERAADGRRVRNAVVAVDAIGVRRRATASSTCTTRSGSASPTGSSPASSTEPETFELDGLRFGLMTCYDLRFPEVGRLLADAGADVFLVPAEWVRGPLKEHHWRTLVHARAIENTVFVAAADHPPPLGVGNSMIVDPQGVEIAAIGTATDVVVAHLDRDAVERVRRVNPALRAAADAGRAARLMRLRVSRRAQRAGMPPLRAPSTRLQAANRTSVAYSARCAGVANAVSGIATTPARSGSSRQNSAASVAPRGAASATVKYEPAGDRHVEAGRAQSRAEQVALCPQRRRRSRVKNASGSRRPVAIAGWNGAPLT